MPELDEFLHFTKSDEFLKLVGPRPFKMDLRTLKGTDKRLDALVEKGYGASRSEAAHLCLQIGLMAFETDNVEFGK